MTRPTVQTLLSAARRHDPGPLRAERADDRPAHRRRRRRRRGCARRGAAGWAHALARLRRARRARPVDAHRRALPRLALDLDRAAALLDDRLHAHEPEPGPLPFGLRREEGLEEVRIAFVHPLARVAGNGDVVAGRKGRARTRRPRRATPPSRSRARRLPAWRRARWPRGSGGAGGSGRRPPRSRPRRGRAGP